MTQQGLVPTSALRPSERTVQPVILGKQYLVNRTAAVKPYVVRLQECTTNVSQALTPQQLHAGLPIPAGLIDPLHDRLLALK